MSRQLAQRVEQLWSSHLRDPVETLRESRLLLESDAAGPGERAWIDLTLGYHHLLRRAPREAAPSLDRALHAFLALGEHRAEMLARTGIARTLIAQGRAGEARDTLLAIYPAAMEQLDARERFWVLDALGSACLYTDGIDDAFRHFHDALGTLRSIEHSPQLPMVMSNLAATLVMMGEYVPARELAQDALGLLPHYDHPEVTLAAQSHLAEALLGTGDMQAALTLVAAMREDPQVLAMSSPQNQHCAVIAEVHARAGMVAIAHEAADCAVRIAADHDAGFNGVHARWAVAVVAEASGDDAAALAAFTDALDAAQAAGHLAITCKAAEHAAGHAAALLEFADAYNLQCIAHRAMERRLASRAQAREHVLRSEHEQERAQWLRDHAERQEQEAAAVDRQLHQMHEELEAKRARLAELEAGLAASPSSG